MIDSIYIKNFKAFTKETIRLDKHNVLIGENDAGKTSVLQALDIFFNQDKIEKIYIRDSSQQVEIGILVNNRFYKKIYRNPTFKEVPADSIGNFELISGLRYIYIPINSYDPKSLITSLAIAKAIESTTTEQIGIFREISQSSLNQVISSVNNDFLVINGEATQIIGNEIFKYEAALKFNIQSNGIAIESRGSGFQKNLMYALLVGNTYENVIVGIDEIENSFSINNCANILSEIQSKIGQTLITTHSRRILEVCGISNIIPLFGDGRNIETLANLLICLDNLDNKPYLLVEGKFDLPWFGKILSLLNRTDRYILLPAGGHFNANLLEECLISKGKNCLVIKDGDTNEEHSLQKECIELYTPLDVINQELDINLDHVPHNKTEFFTLTKIENRRSEDAVKGIISSKVYEFLNLENEVVDEVRVTLDNYEALLAH